MKKIVILLLILLIGVGNIQAQSKNKKKVTKKSTVEWKVSDEIDEYTQLPKKLLCYYDTSRNDEFFKYYPTAEYRIEDSLLVVFTYFKGLPYFDQTWDAIINNGGKFPRYILDEVLIRFIKIDNSYEEFAYRGILSHTSVETAGEDFVGMLITAADPSLMKESKSVSLKWEDELVEKTFTINLNLSGFTKVYNLIK